jgi:hypothetical protein
VPIVINIHVTWTGSHTFDLVYAGNPKMLNLAGSIKGGKLIMAGTKMLNHQNKIVPATLGPLQSVAMPD